MDDPSLWIHVSLRRFCHPTVDTRISKITITRGRQVNKRPQNRLFAAGRMLVPHHFLVIMSQTTGRKIVAEEKGGWDDEKDDFSIGYRIWTEVEADYIVHTVMGVERLPLVEVLPILKDLEMVIIPGEDNCRNMSNYLIVAVWTE